MSVGSSWSRDQQVCASCRYWAGQRDIDYWANFFNVREESGVCNGTDGSFRGMTMGDGASCSAWQAFR